MAGMTICIQTQCPNAGHCYRVQAAPSDWQSMAAFDYVEEDGVVKCGDYIPVRTDPAGNCSGENDAR